MLPKMFLRRFAEGNKLGFNNQIQANFKLATIGFETILLQNFVDSFASDHWDIKGFFGRELHESPEPRLKRFGRW